MNARPVPTVIATVACLLSTSALTRLFEGVLWWFGPVLVATTVAVGTGVASRLLRLPAAAEILLSLVGLIGTVTVLSARSTALLGFLPTATTVETLHTLISAGGSDISRLAAPVPARPGLVVLTVIGVYLLVMIVDLIVVKFDHPTLGGLPLLALYAVSAAILPGGVGVVPFLLGAVSFIALLLLDGRLAYERWGRTVSDQRRAGVEMFGGRIAVGALGVAVTALVAAIVVPLGLPSLDGEGLVSRKGGSGAGDGPSSASVVQPIVSVSQQLHASTEVSLLRLRSDEPKYLRLTALENFDGQLFTLRALNATREDRVSEGLPKPRTGGATQSVRAEVAVTGRFNELYLPVPGIPIRIEGLTGDWRLASPTGTIFSTRTSTANAHYQVDAVVPNPTSAQLQAATGPIPDSLGVATALPDNLDPQLRQLTKAVTAGARTPYEKVYAIQEYLRGPQFTYDLRGAPTTQEGALSQFLFDTHRGYCEQFASAMTVMVRILGLPARVAIGFVPGERQSDGSYVITNRQAHAWPEVWFPSIGWISFEPTRRSDGTTSAPSYAPAGPEDPDNDAALPEEQAQAEPQAVPEPVPVPDTSTPAPGDDPTAMGAARSGDDASTSTEIPSWVVWLCAALPVLGLLAVPAIIRIRRRRVRLRPAEDDPPDPSGATVERVHDAWAELLDVAADLGIMIRPNDSPRAGVARLTAYLDAEPTTAQAPGSGPEPSAWQSGGSEPPTTYPQARAALARLASAEERARYAPPEMAAPPSVADLSEDVVLATTTLLALAPRARRMLARIAPASVLRRAAPASARGRSRMGRGGGKDDGPATPTTVQNEDNQDNQDWLDAVRDGPPSAAATAPRPVP
ncbi:MULTISPECIES: transglutaminaseTgpA domain-containing protein [unclassified Frankia]|uniref:transglutaminaseTgpA domain-containing protein n=1 Tax=unclassified Frankia TaxID=2632575 RepID=UPI0004619E0A|nr:MULTISPECIES: transglutaminaseTgpA domain-containing protein [unclassified Frankia]KDA44011.1 transglutaminase-like enzyme, predicted cysteine protease [Frankia sp. BMG5.23]